MKTEIAWAAGFFDGEGCVGYYTQNYRMSACVVQKDLRPLYRFLSAVGFGKVYPNKNAGIGKASRWQVTSAGDVVRLYELLLPYLSEPKKEQFQRSIEAWTQRPSKRYHYGE